MPDFSKTVIYKIINYDYPDLIYVGSTTNFTERTRRHKYDTLKNMTSTLYENIRRYGGWESWEMVKICDYPCISGIEARQEEDRHMVELRANLNTNKAYNNKLVQQRTQKAYMQMFYNKPNDFINKRYSAKQLYDKSKVFALENGLSDSYSIQEFGQAITNLIGNYKKRTGAGYIYNLCMDIDEFNKLLSENEQLDKFPDEQSDEQRKYYQELKKNKLGQPKTQEAYIQMFYKKPNDFINKRYSAKQLFDLSKVFALENGLSDSYSIQEFGQGITKLINNYKKRTSSGFVYELFMNIDEFNEILSDYDPEYYQATIND